MPAVDKHKRQRILVLVNSKPERSLRKEAAHHFVNGEAIFGRQEIVSSVNCSSPNFDDTIALILA